MEISEEITTALQAIASGASASSLESSTLDFKQDSPRGPGETLRSIVEVTLCLANSYGGLVVVGVADRVPGQAAFLGTSLTPAQVELHVHNSTRPGLTVRAAAFDFQDVRLLAIAVPQGTEVHADTKGRAPRRLGTDCEGMDPSEQQWLREERSGFDWSSQLATDSVSISRSAISVARRRLDASARPERRALARLSDEDLLRALGVLDSSGSATRAAAVLAGESGSTALYTYASSPGGEPENVERLHAPLLTSYDRIMELIALRRRLTAVSLPDGQQLQVEDFPELAVREALTNALVHRDLRIPGPVVVEHSPTVLAITSPGSLVAGVSSANILTHPSKPRNRSLMAAIRTLELAEEVGRGVDRMYREMVRSGRPTPTIEASHDQVRVVLVGTAPNVNIARYVGQLPSAVRDNTDAMITLLKLCSTRTVTARTMAPFIQKGVDETEASMRELASVQVAMIEPTRQTYRNAYPSYRLRESVIKELGTAVPYATHSSEDIERRVIAHMHEYGRITNGTVQNLFNVTSRRAHQIISDLVRRNILVKTTTAQRGPGVEYGTGSQFPDERSIHRRTRRRGGD